MEGLIVLSSIFNYSLGGIISYLTGWDHSIVLRVLAVGMLLFSIYKFISEKNKVKSSIKTQKVLFRLLLLYFLILGGMLFTAFMHDNVVDVMKTYLLSFGTRILGAILLGYCLVVDTKLFRNTLKWIEPFCVFFTITLFTVVRKNAGESIMSLQINRQELSYSGAFSFALLLFYCFNSNTIEKIKLINKKWVVFLNYFILALDLYIVLAGGGRGAFVLIVIIALYYLIILFTKKNYKGFIAGFSSFILLSVFFVYLSSVSSINDGYLHIIDSFTSSFSDRSSQERLYLWSRAYTYINDSLLIGNGAGSTAYTVGFYTHNIFIDILLEYGIIGLIVAFIIFAKVIKKGIKLSRSSILIEFADIVFLCGFVMLLFSGSFYSEATLWVALTVVLCYDTSY